jgi:hypothetical protein
MYIKYFKFHENLPEYSKDTCKIVTGCGLNDQGSGVQFLVGGGYNEYLGLFPWA